jgi:hypothetical protein
MKNPWPDYLPIPKNEQELLECIKKMKLNDLLEFEKGLDESKKIATDQVE